MDKSWYICTWYICMRKGVEIPSTAVGYASPVGCVLDNWNERGLSVVAVKAEVEGRYNYVGGVVAPEDAAKCFLEGVSLLHVVEKEDLADRLEKSFRTSFYQGRILNRDIEGVVAAFGLSNLPATVDKPVRGFKALCENMKPKWGPNDFFYEIGRWYRMGGLVAPCNRGYHFCEKLADVFHFYEAGSRVFEVEASGRVVRSGTKAVASRIKLVREIGLDEQIKRLKKDRSRLRSLIRRCERSDLILKLEKEQEK